MKEVFCEHEDGVCKNCGHISRGAGKVFRVCRPQQKPIPFTYPAPTEADLPLVPPVPFRFGDLLYRLLQAIGITERRVEKVIGRPCGCAGRRIKMNRFGFWLWIKTQSLRVAINSRIFSAP